jgi:hypothetical protein
MRLSRRIFTTTLATACVLTVDIAWAAITSITVNTEPITVGQTVQYVANMNSQDGPPGPTNWDYRATEQGNVSPWFTPPITSGSSISWTERRIGSYNVRARTKFANGSTSEQIRSVTVHAPDEDVITGGLNTPSNGSTLTVTFDLRRSGTPMGPGTVDGYPEERIRRPQFQMDSGFVGPSQSYYLTGNRAIIDNKYSDVSHADFINCPVNGVFDDLYQQNRMVIKDGFGTNQFFYFPERHFQRVKLGPSSWQLVEVP